MSELARLQRLEKTKPTPWIPFPSVAAGTLITATTTDPGYGTVQTNKAYYKIEGNMARVMWIFRQSANGTAGSGSYIFNLPKPLVIDTTKVKDNSNFASDQTFSDGSVGMFYSNNFAGDIHLGHAVVYTPTSLKFDLLYDANDYIWGSTNTTFGIVAYFSLLARFPIKRTI